jgi:hypothetical protein
MNNLTSSVNVAFLDRADLKVSVGLPILEAWYEILKRRPWWNYCTWVLFEIIMWVLFDIIIMSFATFTMFLHDQWARQLQWALSEMRQSCRGLECMKPLTAAFIESCTVYQIYTKGFLGELYQGTKTGNNSSTKIYQPLGELSQSNMITVKRIYCNLGHHKHDIGKKNKLSLT